MSVPNEDTDNVSPHTQFYNGQEESSIPPSNPLIVGGSASIIKTIVGEDGAIYDCVDFYKQPAFSSPLLKDHIIEMKPSFSPVSADKFESRSSDDRMSQICWPDALQCPEGTIPILRTKCPLQRRRPPPFLSRSSDDGLFQSWNKIEQCPEGTISSIGTKFPPKHRDEQEEK